MSIEKRFNPDKTWVGITPTSWWNDDFLDIDAGITFGQCVSEMAFAGYAGCSVGHKFPTDTAVLLPELEQRKLRVSEPWTSTYFTLPKMHDKTIANFKTSMSLIKALGGSDLVVAEIGGSSHPLPIDLFANRRVLNDAEWTLLADGLNEIGKLAKDARMTLCYHHHMGTGVMTQPDIDRLASVTDPDLVHFLFDTGHLFYAGGDPLHMACKYAKRIKHCHLKNIRKPAMDKVIADGLSFKDGILLSLKDGVPGGVFTVPGDPEGCIDFKPILQVLADADFEGWLIVEAEQNPATANPLKYATMAREYMKNVIHI